MKLALAVLLLAPGLAAAQAPQVTQADRDAWNKPIEPFRIMGNLYYVGPAGISSFLITSRQGHILIDTGFEETVPLIRANVEKLGFQVKDIKVLLSSHGHADHVGGHAAMQEATGAQVMASERDSALMARGGRNDHALGDGLTYRAIKVDHVIRDREEVSVGEATVTARLTPGHTPGCTTWTMKVDDEGRPRHVVFHCSTSILPGVTLRGNAKYPLIAEDFKRTFEVLRSLPCDVFLGPHGQFFGLEEKSERLRKGEKPNPFVDPKGYRQFVDRGEQTYLQKLASEAGR
jgi:metallo-beta-lactamase class B